MLPERLAFIDLETTGTNPTRDRITEIGIVLVEGEQIDVWSTLVNPERPIPEFIQQLTGIRNEMVASAPGFAEIADELAQRLEGCLFIAHNARFDYGFIRNEFLRLGRRFRADVLCTVRLSRKLFPQHPRHNLDSLIERHGLSHPDRHRALADADLVWQFWRKVRAQTDQDRFEEAIQLQLKRPALPPHLDPAMLEDLPESPGVYLFFGENDVLLYVGKSINLRKRVLAHFAADTRENKEMRLSQEVRRIDWQETVGEFGALLLESRLVKTRQPMHNRQLKHATELCAWSLEERAPGDYRPRLLGVDDAEFRIGNLYGLFGNRREAANALRRIAEAYQLCPIILGLEKTAQPGRPCFSYQIHQCKGACIGRESLGLHSARLMTALAKLRLQAWPYDGPVGLVERDDFLDIEEMHVIDNWRYLGTATSEEEVHELLAQAASVPFDRDTYRLVQARLGKGKLTVRRL